MWGIISTIFILFVLFQIFKAITDTQRGAFVLIILPLLLCVVNFTIAWENYWDGVPFPNPVSPDGFIYDIIARIIGGSLDKLFGVNIFAISLAWILGALFYVAIFTGLHIFVIRLFIQDISTEIGNIVFIGWLAFFTFFYYFHGLDSFSIFRWLSMPYEVGTNVLVYYWIAIAIALVLHFKSQID